MLRSNERAHDGCVYTKGVDSMSSESERSDTENFCRALTVGTARVAGAIAGAGAGGAVAGPPGALVGACAGVAAADKASAKAWDAVSDALKNK